MLGLGGWALGAFCWEGRGLGVRGGMGTGGLTSSIRVLERTPLILTYNHYLGHDVRGVASIAFLQGSAYGGFQTMVRA